MRIYIVSKEPINSYDLSKCSFKSFYESDAITYCYVLDESDNIDLIDSTDYDYLDGTMKDQLLNELEMNPNFPEEKIEFKMMLIKITRVKNDDSNDDSNDDIIDIDADISYDDIIKYHKPLQDYIHRTTSNDYIRSTYFNANTTTKNYSFCAGTKKRHITTINGYGYLNDVMIYL